MINDVENKDSLNRMSDLEFDKNSVEMLRYRTNKLSYTIGLLGIGFSLLAAFILFNSMAVNTPFVLFKILINIVILLFGFLFCEKVKNYSFHGSYGLFVLSGLCILRIFLLPLFIITDYAKLQAGEATKWLGESLLNTNHAVAWLTSNGYVRGVLAIVLLGLAAACFIYSGLIGMKKTIRLTKYLNSIGEKY